MSVSACDSPRRLPFAGHLEAFDQRARLPSRNRLGRWRRIRAAGGRRDPASSSAARRPPDSRDRRPRRSELRPQDARAPEHRKASARELERERRRARASAEPPHALHGAPTSRSISSATASGRQARTRRRRAQSRAGSEVLVLRDHEVHALLVTAGRRAQLRRSREREVVLRMRPPQRSALRRRLQPLGGDTRGSSRASRTGLVRAADEALVDERLERVEVGVGDRLGRLERAAAAEDREPREERAARLVQQVVAPLDRRAERLLARVGVAAALEEVRRCSSRSRSCSARGRLARAAASSIASGRWSSRRADLARRRRRREVELRPRARQKSSTASARRAAGTAYSCSPATRSSSRLVTSSRGSGTRRAARRVGAGVERRARSCRAAGAAARRRCARRAPPCAPSACATVSRHERRIAKRRQRHPAHAVREVVGTSSAAACEREARLAGAAGAGERQQPHVVAGSSGSDLGQLALSAEERAWPARAGSCSESVLSGGNSLVAELVDALRRREVLEPVLAEVAQASSRRRASRWRRETRTCPPWPAAAIRAARWTSRRRSPRR